MNKLIRFSFSAILLGFAAGCWSFGTSEYPKTCITQPVPGKDISLAVLGFDAVLTEYVTATGYQTVYVPGGPGPYWGGWGWMETVPTQTTWAQARPTDMFKKRAVDLFEKGGFVMGAASPDWTVEVNFEGPFRESSDSAWRATWMICTIFFCDYTAETWKAALRIRDNRTGKLVFSNDYLQRYETKAFGLIPLFGIASCHETDSAFCQNWCLTALTDRMVAEASAIISRK